jgi:8-oxo-dGTP diphosphatase
MSHRLAVAVMVLNSENKVLLVKGHIRGWEFPGGYVGWQEPVKDAAIREVREETGIDIELTKFCGIEQDIQRNTCVILFIAKPINGTLAVDHENTDIGYFAIDEAIDKIDQKNSKERIPRCLDDKVHPFVLTI